MAKQIKNLNTIQNLSSEDYIAVDTPNTSPTYKARIGDIPLTVFDCDNFIQGSIDEGLSLTSTNPVQNKVITASLNEKLVRADVPHFINSAEIGEGYTASSIYFTEDSLENPFSLSHFYLSGTAIINTADIPAATTNWFFAIFTKGNDDNWGGRCLGYKSLTKGYNRIDFAAEGFYLGGCTNTKTLYLLNSPDASGTSGLEINSLCLSVKKPITEVQIIAFCSGNSGTQIIDLQPQSCLYIKGC